MSLTYAQYIASLANLADVPSDDPNFNIDLPNIIDYAELRIYRDIDLLDTVRRDASNSLVAGDRNFTLPSASGSFVVTQEFNVITPASATTADGGTRNQLVPTSMAALNALWPNSSGSTVPQYFAMVNQGAIIVGPWPNAAYRIEVVGTIRPLTLSSTNVTTLLSTYWPDLLLAASMVRVAGYQKNYGQGIDDPKMAITWETTLQDLLKSANVEEMRKKFTSQGWSSENPAPLATPPRT